MSDIDGAFGLGSAGRVADRIAALKEQARPIVLKFQRDVLDKLVGIAITDEQFAAYQQEEGTSIELAMTSGAIAGYLQEEHDRRSAWEKQIEERIAKLEGAG